MHKKLDGKGHIALWVIVKRRWGYMTFAADNELEMLFNPAQLAQWFPAQFQAAMRSQAFFNAKLQAKWDSKSWLSWTLLKTLILMTSLKHGRNFQPLSESKFCFSLISCCDRNIKFIFDM